MNRMYTNTHLALEKRVVALYLNAAIGSTGAPTLSAANSKGIASIARTATGKYTVTLADKYVALLMAQVAVIKASGDPVTTTPVIRSFDGTLPTLVVEFLDDSGAAAELASGDTLLLKLELKASSV